MKNLKKIKEISELQKIRPEAIITTNYDTLLEDIIFCDKCCRYIGQEGLSYNYSETEDKINLYKIHGCVESPTLFWEYPVIFIGYSVSDRNIKDILTLMIEIMTDEQKVEFLEHIWIVDFAENENEECVTDKEIKLLNGEKIKISCFSLNCYLKFYKEIKFYYFRKCY